ncbi:MAG: hypothetical protein Q7R32_08350 [Dehalococcoidia bacterium]|nr:hypothetical protein [Dehalococcoidia bacterium]
MKSDTADKVTAWVALAAFLVFVASCFTQPAGAVHPGAVVVATVLVAVIVRVILSPFVRKDK